MSPDAPSTSPKKWRSMSRGAAKSMSESLVGSALRSWSAVSGDWRGFRLRSFPPAVTCWTKAMPHGCWMSGCPRAVISGLVGALGDVRRGSRDPLLPEPHAAIAPPERRIPRSSIGLDLVAQPPSASHAISGEPSVDRLFLAFFVISSVVHDFTAELR